MKFSLLIVVIAALLTRQLVLVIDKNLLYTKTGLYPIASDDVWKVIVGYGLVSIPWLQRTIKEDIFKIKQDDQEKYATNENFHNDLQFGNALLGKTKFHESKYFAENFYTYMGIPNNTDLVVTTRLSFYGKNAAHIIPWFTFSYKGEEFNLPKDFEDKTIPFNKDAAIKKREAIAPGLGSLLFECEEPMKKWFVSYKGIVVSSKTNKQYKIEARFDLTYTAESAFYYQIHWDEMTAARSMSRKVWDSIFWRDLRAQNQGRYANQAAKVTGSIKYLEDETPFESKELVFDNMDGSLDHNHGIRNWRYIWRYVSFYFYF